MYVSIGEVDGIWDDIKSWWTGDSTSASIASAAIPGVDVYRRAMTMLRDFYASSIVLDGERQKYYGNIRKYQSLQQSGKTDAQLAVMKSAINKQGNALLAAETDRFNTWKLMDKAILAATAGKWNVSIGSSAQLLEVINELGANASSGGLGFAQIAVVMVVAVCAALIALAISIPLTIQKINERTLISKASQAAIDDAVKKFGVGGGGRDFFAPIAETMDSLKWVLVAGAAIYILVMIQKSGGFSALGSMFKNAPDAPNEA